MKGLEKDIKIIEKAMNENYSLSYIRELYESDKYSYFYFSKKSKIIFLLICFIITVLGLINYFNIVTIFGIIGIIYFSYSLGMVKGFNIGADEGLREGFETGYVNTTLDLLKRLLKKKKEENKEPEKALINILLMALSGRFGDYNDLLKDKQNKNMIEFELNKIIEREKEKYFK